MPRFGSAARNPAVPTAKQWVELVEEARDARAVLLEGIRTEYDPGNDAVREILPKLGRIRRVSLRYKRRSDRCDQVLAGHMVKIFDAAVDAAHAQVHQGAPRPWPGRLGPDKRP